MPKTDHRRLSTSHAGERSRCICLTLLIACLVTTVAGRPQLFGQTRSAPRPLGIEEMYRAATFRDSASISPDGRWIAYVLQERRPSGELHDVTYLTEVAGGGTTVLGDALGGGTATWSPDGRYLAYYVKDDSVGRLWLWSPENRKARQLSPAAIQWAYREVPRWAPDSRSLIVKITSVRSELDRANAAVGEQQQSRPVDSTVMPGATAIVRRNDRPRKPLSSGNDADQEIQTTDLGYHPADLARIDVTDGTLRRLATEIETYHWYVSPDGKTLVISETVGFLPHRFLNAMRLVAMSLEDGSQRVLATNLPMHGLEELSWSPDGKTIGYVVREASVKDSKETYGVYIVPLLVGPPRRLSSGQIPNLTMRSTTHAPVWSSRGDALFLISDDKLWRVPVDGSGAYPVTENWDRDVYEILTDNSGASAWDDHNAESVVVFARDRTSKRAGAYRAEIRKNHVTPILEEEAYFGPEDTNISAAAVSADGRTVIYLRQAASSPPNLWVAGVDFTTRRQLTHVNNELESIRLGDSLVVAYHYHNYQLYGTLLLPAGYERGKRYPLIVWVYPGPSHWSYRADVFGVMGGGMGRSDELQLLATRGYAVLIPEVPQDVSAPMGGIVGPILSALDAVNGLGIVNPDRVGVMGHSYGGYAVLALITQTNRFKAAVAHSGFADVIRMYQVLFNEDGTDTTSFVESGQIMMAATPWEQPLRYRENSPFTYLDRVTTPLLILHGGDDHRLIQQSDGVFVGLRRLGREVEYRKYIGEGHGLRKLENIVDAWTAIFRWFDTHLGNGPIK